MARSRTIETDQGLVRSTCTHCTAGCGVLVRRQDGRVVSVQGDPDHPGSRGVMCLRGRAAVEYLESPARLRHPLRRVGERGEGRWQEVSWDDALQLVAEGLGRAKATYAAESVAFIRGVAKGYQDRWLARFANVFGSPNALSTSHICWVPQVTAARLTYGFDARGDYEGSPGCILVWGGDPQATNVPRHVEMERALAAGAKLVVVDPAPTWYAQRADAWARLRPGSDLVLALGVIRAIVEQGLYDAGFVEGWTIGFAELCAAVERFTPEEVERLTWVPAATVREIARLYAGNGPAVLESGWGIDATVYNFQAGRALAILRAITGNLGRPGGEVEWLPPNVVDGGSPELNQQDAVSAEVRARRIGAEEGMLPTYFAALPQTVVKAMLSGEPYPVRAAYVAGSSMLQTYPDVHEVKRALESLDFLAVADLFMTSTAALADVVLPVTSYLEMDAVHKSSNSPVVSVVQKVADCGEAWSDLRICSRLATAMGFGDRFWADEEEALDYLLAPAGLTFAELREVGWLPAEKVYGRHEEAGFATPSKKVELYSDRLAEWGFDPLPAAPLAADAEPMSPEGHRADTQVDEEFPLLLTSWKPEEYYHSSGRHIPLLRAAHPRPLVLLHPDTASAAGVGEGDPVVVATRHGEMTQTATLSDAVDRRVVIAEPNWWFPEQGAERLYGWLESNLNVLTSSERPYCREMGATTLRGLACRIARGVD